MYTKARAITAWGSTSMRTAPVKAIALPPVYRANLSFKSTCTFQHSRTRVIYAEGSALQCIHSLFCSRMLMDMPPTNRGVFRACVNNRYLCGFESQSALKVVFGWHIHQHSITVNREVGGLPCWVSSFSLIFCWLGFFVPFLLKRTACLLSKCLATHTSVED